MDSSSVFKMKSNSINKLRCSECCTNLSKIFQCSRCLGVSYCSKICQERHWTAHKSTCKKLSKESYEFFLKEYCESELAMRKGDFTAAEIKAKNALLTSEQIFRSDDVRIASPLVLLGQVEQALGKSTDAIAYFERAYLLYSNVYGSVHMHVQEITFLLINTLLQCLDWDKAYLYAEMNYQILVDFEGECTCFLIAETARQLGAIYKHFNMIGKEEVMYRKALEHYNVCPDIATRERVDENYKLYGGYLGLINKQLQDLLVRQKVMSGVTPAEHIPPTVRCEACL